VWSYWAGGGTCPSTTSSLSAQRGSGGQIMMSVSAASCSSSMLAAYICQLRTKIVAQKCNRLTNVALEFFRKLCSQMNSNGIDLSTRSTVLGSSD
jgi:predicted Na+-dependent transporter